MHAINYSMADEIREVWCEMINDGQTMQESVEEIAHNYDIPADEVVEIINAQAG